MWRKLLFRSGWKSCFILTLVIFFLQSAGFIGLFLSFLGAEYWSVILINLGFVLMAIDGFAPDQPRWKRWVPAAWFGGYSIIAAASQAFTAQFYAEIDRENAAQSIEWDSERNSIALAHSWSDENRAVAFGASDLVRRYGLSFGYDGAVDMETKSVTGYRRTWLVRENCSPMDSSAGIQRTTITRGGLDKPFERADGLCLYSRTQQPSEGTISFVNQGIEKRDILLAREVERIVVTKPNGETLSLAAGWSSPLHWFPAPSLGCTRHIYDDPNWCGLRFLRESSRETGRTPEKVIAAFLGLKLTSIEQRYPDLQWHDFGTRP